MRLPWSKPTLAERAIAVGNIATAVSLSFVIVHEAATRFYNTFIADKRLTPAAQTVEGKYSKAANT